MAQRKRNSLGDVLHDFQQFMYYRGQQSNAKKSFDSFGKKLKTFLDNNGTELKDDEGNPGNIVYRFGQPVYIGEKAYAGFEKRRTDPSPAFDEDAALELAKVKGIDLSEVAEQIWVADQNAFYRLHQKGVFSEEEIDSLLVLPEGAEPVYRFFPLEAAGEDMEENE
jgi:hypothetical protein